MSVADVGSAIDRMANLLSHIMSLSGKIGGFGDGPRLRGQIQADVQVLTETGQQVKNTLSTLKTQGVYGIDNYIERYSALRARIQQELPIVIQRLRAALPTSSSRPAPEPDMRQPLMMDQGLLDGEADEIDVLEQNVNDVVVGMRDANELFSTTHQEIQSQRHLITRVDSVTSESGSEMAAGNKSLQKGERCQESSTKCICWIAIILLIVVVAVVLIVLSQTVWKADPKTPPPPTGEYQLS
jgi:uncharacterized phage infection (PIP) family protein YhgE